MAADRPDLQALVENPRESLEVEIKDWIDLKDNVVRANIARHIAALATLRWEGRSFSFVPTPIKITDGSEIWPYLPEPLTLVCGITRNSGTLVSCDPGLRNGVAVTASMQNYST